MTKIVKNFNNKMFFFTEDDLFREWMEWSDCSKTCDGGTQIRKRNCVNATNCQGINSQERDCNEMKCPGTVF